MSKRILVTGGAGFIGSHAVDHFLSLKWEVVVVDDFSTGKRTNIPEAVEVHEFSVLSKEFFGLVVAERFDLILHLAAQMDVRKSVANPGFDANTNILGTISLMEAIRSSGRPTRIIFSSTGGVLYGEFTTPPNVETFPKDPESPYAISKLSAELYLAYYARVHGIDGVSLRLGNVYGPRQDPHGEAGVVAIFCGNILAGSPIRIFGDGHQTRDYVFVGDVCRAFQLAGEASLPSQGRLDSRAFNIGTGLGTSVLQLAAALETVTGRVGRVVFAERRKGEQQHSFLDVKKAHSVLRWDALVSLSAGLTATYDWFRQSADNGTSAGE